MKRPTHSTFRFLELNVVPGHGILFVPGIEVPDHKKKATRTSRFAATLASLAFLAGWVHKMGR